MNYATLHESLGLSNISVSWIFLLLILAVYMKVY